jgi:dihydrofolate synthase/folylpolyglutamate synthase
LSDTPEAILDRLTRLYPKLIDLSLDRVVRFLGELGNPHHDLPPVVHVAGTNGKGSTIATLRACLEQAGYRCHVYTSPHLVRFEERIRIAGRIIEAGALTELLLEIERTNAGRPITFFEITTAAAFLAFSRARADIVLLETGLGGRYDATNVIEAPAAAAITPISFDHMSYLGDTLAAIAGEKAMILKPGAPAVIGPQPAEAQIVFDQRASEIGAPLARFGQEWHAMPAGDGWHYEGTRWSLDLPLSVLPGRHQIDNAGLAVAVLEQLERFDVPAPAIRAGLQRIEWPGRLQRLTRGPLIDRLPAGTELWIDGGHNPSAGEALAAMAATYWADRPLHLVLGILDTKDAVGFLRPLARHAVDLQAVTIPHEAHSLSAEAGAAAARAAGIKAVAAPDIDSALDRIAVAARGPIRVLICGSLYFAGSVLAENG